MNRFKKVGAVVLIIIINILVFGIIPLVVVKRFCNATT